MSRIIHQARSPNLDHFPNFVRIYIPSPSGVNGRRKAAVNVWRMYIYLFENSQQLTAVLTDEHFPLGACGPSPGILHFRFCATIAP
jgi:hypothetical protein